MACVTAIPFAAILGVAMVMSSMRASAQSGDWQIGHDVGLAAGTCIRQGPGLGSKAHTTVPKDDWTVRVIGGPRSADGLTWFDTSREAAGDPSGGTGWVAREQTDRNCGTGERQPSVPSPDDIMSRLRRWWNAQDNRMHWIVIIAVLVAIVFAWNQTSPMLLTLVGAAFMGAILWWLTDAVRDVWQLWWWGVVGRDGPDLALIVSLVPIVSAFVRAVTARSRYR